MLKNGFRDPSSVSRFPWLTDYLTFPSELAAEDYFGWIAIDSDFSGIGRDGNASVDKNLMNYYHSDYSQTYPEHYVIVDIQALKKVK